MSADAAWPRPVDLVLDAVNAMFVRQRHAQEDAASPALAASRASGTYIEQFWPSVVRLVADDPRRLGLSLATPGAGARRSLNDVRRARDVVAAAGDDRLALAALAPQRMMIEVLNAATGEWAQALRSGRCPLAFAVDAERYVSLRALLPQREGGAAAVGANAPTLVMGGTTTALTLCWNLLLRLPLAWRDLHGKVIDRATLETQWNATRELLFRIGAGSLTAFVALASACASDSTALRWPGMQDLTLVEVDGRHQWAMNAALFRRMLDTVNRMHLAQQGEYVGCAALFVRAPVLPLAADYAESVDAGREPSIFSELLRWITAVARAEFFPLYGGAR